jgi:hypothetical protein
MAKWRDIFKGIGTCILLLFAFLILRSCDPDVEIKRAQARADDAYALADEARVKQEDAENRLADTETKLKDADDRLTAIEQKICGGSTCDE